MEQGYRYTRVISKMLPAKSATHMSDTLNNSVHWTGGSESDHAILYTSIYFPMKSESLEINTFYAAHTISVHFPQHCVVVLKKSTNPLISFLKKKKTLSRGGSEKVCNILLKKRNMLSKSVRFLMSNIPINRK